MLRCEMKRPGLPRGPTASGLDGGWTLGQRARTRENFAPQLGDRSAGRASSHPVAGCAGI